MTYVSYIIIKHSLLLIKILNLKLVAKKQYAKRKAMYLNRCFQTGETPVPGPVGGKIINLLRNLFFFKSS